MVRLETQIKRLKGLSREWELALKIYRWSDLIGCVGFRKNPYARAACRPGRDKNLDITWKLVKYRRLSKGRSL